MARRGQGGPFEIKLRSHPEPIRTRFHSDDVIGALAVLMGYLPMMPITLDQVDDIQEAFGHAILHLEAAMSRREESDLDAQFRLEVARRAQYSGNMKD